MSLWLMLVIPYGLSLGLWVVRRLTRLAAPLSACGYLALAISLSFTSAEPFVLLGRTFVLGANTALYLMYLAVSLSLLMLVGLANEESALVWPGSLASFGFLIASACATSVEIAGAFLTLATLGVAFCLIAPTTAETAMRTILMMLAGAIFLLVAGWAIDSAPFEDPALLVALGRPAALFGLWLLLGAFPFGLWVPPLGRSERPTAAFLATCALSLIVCLRIPDLMQLTEPSLLSLAMLWGGVATVLYGAAGALLSTHVSGIVSYAALADMGIMLLSLSHDPADLMGLAAQQLAYRALACAILWGGARLLAHCFGSDDIRDLGGAVRRTPLTLSAITLASYSLSGLPPMAGYAGRAAISAGTGWPGMWGAFWIIATVGAAWGLGRVVIASWGASPPPGSHREPRLVATVLLAGGLLLLALGLIPGINEGLRMALLAWR